MGESTMLPGEVTAQSGRRCHACAPRSANSTIPGLGARASPVGLAIRPEHLRLGSGEGGLPLGSAMVKDVVFQGSFKRVMAVSQADPEVRFIARVPAGMPVAPDETVEHFCRPEDVILLER